MNLLLRQICGWSLAGGFLVGYLWQPTWANPADAPSRCAGLRDCRSKLPHFPLPLLQERLAPQPRHELDALLTVPMAGCADEVLMEQEETRWRRLDDETTGKALFPLELLPLSGRKRSVLGGLHGQGGPHVCSAEAVWAGVVAFN